MSFKIRKLKKEFLGLGKLVSPTASALFVSYDFDNGVLHFPLRYSKDGEVVQLQEAQSWDVWRRIKRELKPILAKFQIKSVVIDNGYIVPDHAFENELVRIDKTTCGLFDSLLNMTISPTTVLIGDSALKGCKNLKFADAEDNSFTYRNSIRYLGKNCFEGTSILKAYVETQSLNTKHAYFARLTYKAYSNMVLADSYKSTKDDIELEEFRQNSKNCIDFLSSCLQEVKVGDTIKPNVDMWFNNPTTNPRFVISLNCNNWNLKNFDELNYRFKFSCGDSMLNSPTTYKVLKNKEVVFEDEFETNSTQLYVDLKNYMIQRILPVQVVDYNGTYKDKYSLYYAHALFQFALKQEIMPANSTISPNATVRISDELINCADIVYAAESIFGSKNSLERKFDIINRAKEGKLQTSDSRRLCFSMVDKHFARNNEDYNLLYVANVDIPSKALKGTTHVQKVSIERGYNFDNVLNIGPSAFEGSSVKHFESLKSDFTLNLNPQVFEGCQNITINTKGPVYVGYRAVPESAKLSGTIVQSLHEMVD